MTVSKRYLIAAVVTASLFGGVGLPYLGREFDAYKLRLVNRLMAEELARRAPPDSAAWGVKEWKMHAARCDAALDDASERLATIAASVDLRPLRE